MNVAVIGKMGAGKSTVASHLIEHYAYRHKSFAKALKVMCGTDTDRELLQRVGVGVRELVEDGWVNLLKADLIGDSGPFVVDDCRFPNEVNALQGLGFKFVEVLAHEGDRVERLQAIGKITDLSQLEHESETALDDLEFPRDTLYNDGDIREFGDEIDAWVNRVRRRVA